MRGARHEKLDQLKVEYIAAKKKMAENKITAESTDITVRCVQKLRVRSKNAPEGKIAFPARVDRSPRGPHARSGRHAALAARYALKSGAGRIWDRMMMSRMTVPKGVARAVLQESDEAVGRK